MDKVYIIGKDIVPSSFSLYEEDLKLSLIVLPGVSEDIDIQIDINSAGCRVELVGVYLCSGEDKLNLKVNLRHNCGGSYSHQLFKGIVSDSAKACFDGLIYVARDAQKTKAYQQNHSILLSSNALAQSMPQLEIYADDVECSHGSTSGYLNPEELFYMRSRGIPEVEALQLQKRAFIASAISHLPEEICELIYDNIP